MTSSFSCALSAWLRRASALGLALLPVTATAAGPVESTRGGDIEQSWSHLAQAIEPFNADLVKQRGDELLAVAGRSELERLTPFALALVIEARTVQPDRAGTLLDLASRLDPGSAEVEFSLANRRFRSLSLVGGTSALANGLIALLNDGRLVGVVRAGGLLALVVVFAAAFALWTLLAIRRAVPRLWHDLTELGGQWRLGSNGPVLAVLILALPTFVGGDPAWLLLWLLALSWGYLSAGNKLVGAVGLLFVASTPTLVEFAFGAMSHPPNPIVRAAAALEEHRYAPQVVDELAALADLFGDDAGFRRLQGDLYRQFGMLDAAAWAYREGLRLEPRNGPLSLGLGTVQYAEGDFNSALQSFQIAREAGTDAVAVNYDLSLTLGQTYHFRESDQAIEEARKAGEARLRELTRGRNHQLIVPYFTPDDAAAMLARKDPVVLLNRGLLPAPLVRERTVLHPLTVAALFALMLAIGHFLVRERTTGFASACLKCGRPFCRRCKLSQESQSYCTQCVNIFLKKDMVAIEVQMAKRRQLRRHQMLTEVERRVSDALVPGLGLTLAGRPAVGLLLVLVSAVSVAAAAVWLPRLVGPALLQMSLWPLETVGALIWLLAACGAQLIPTERR